MVDQLYRILEGTLLTMVDLVDSVCRQELADNFNFRLHFRSRH
jgi:hypothetical protein